MAAGFAPAKWRGSGPAIVDSAQGVIRVAQSKGRKDRHVMPPEEGLELLRQWWKERPARRRWSAWIFRHARLASR
jgi:hypothetical protein